MTSRANGVALHPDGKQQLGLVQHHHRVVTTPRQPGQRTAVVQPILGLTSLERVPLGLDGPGDAHRSVGLARLQRECHLPQADVGRSEPESKTVGVVVWFPELGGKFLRGLHGRCDVTGRLSAAAISDRVMVTIPIMPAVSTVVGGSDREANSAPAKSKAPEASSAFADPNAATPKEVASPRRWRSRCSLTSVRSVGPD